MRALSTGAFLIILALLMPAVFAQLSKTLVVFLESAQQAFAAAGILAAHAVPPQ